MKKILIVISTLEQGGGQKFVMDLAKEIDKNKFEVKVLVYYRYSNSVFDKFAVQNDIDVVYLDKKLGLDLTFFKKVNAFVKEYQPDVIHTNLDTMLYLFFAYRRNQVKLHTLHTLAEKEASGLQYIVRLIGFKLLGVIPVAICDTVADSIARRYHIKRKAVPIVYNGVNCQRYDVPKVISQNIRLITVGNIYQVKNYHFLVECFSEICKKFEQTTLTIVGDGVLRRELEEQINTLNISEKVCITGIVSNVEEYLADADIYVASSYYEGLPISMLEAMSAGLPVISTDVGGVNNIIKNGENGVLVALGDKEGYVKALLELISNTQKRLEYSKKSKSFSRKYDISMMVEGYEKLYQG